MKKIIILLLAIVLFSCNRKAEVSPDSNSYTVTIDSNDPYECTVNGSSFYGRGLTYHYYAFIPGTSVNIDSDKVVEIRVYKNGVLFYFENKESFYFIAQ